MRRRLRTHALSSLNQSERSFSQHFREPDLPKIRFYPFCIGVYFTMTSRKNLTVLRSTSALVDKENVGDLDLLD